MRTNPFFDAWLFLIGSTDDYRALGALQYVFVALFLALVVTSVWIALKTWREDPAQRKESEAALRAAMGAETSLQRSIPCR